MRMPIKAENKHRYPLNWREIRAAILERAGHRCEQCRAENYQPHPITGSRVVLTIAHVHDPDPANCDPANLLALCQKCHNTLDAPMRAVNARATRRAKKAAGDFFPAHG
jgi:5-methylcytosine-specific restriction endonuclease McrA